ncbi:Uncharacterized protein Fot_11464 [Forsythia ovata]|uniref:Uncharacterized protein n=1 Tax=Forsythia ovata TaxID=205694 RepID=A0ABD1WJT2_9LAMI
MVIQEDDSSTIQFSSVQPDLETQSFARDDVEPIMLDDNLIQNEKRATSVEDYDPIDDAEQYEDFIDEYENDEHDLDNDDSEDGANEDHSDDDDVSFFQAHSATEPHPQKTKTSGIGDRLKREFGAPSGKWSSRSETHLLRWKFNEENENNASTRKEKSSSEVSWKGGRRIRTVVSARKLRCALWRIHSLGFRLRVANSEGTNVSQKNGLARAYTEKAPIV